MCIWPLPESSQLKSTQGILRQTVTDYHTSPAPQTEQAATTDEVKIGEPGIGLLTLCGWLGGKEALHSTAAAVQSSSLGVQQRQAAHLLHHVKGLPAGLCCTCSLLLPQQAHCLPHLGLYEHLAATHVQVAQLWVRLRHRNSLLQQARDTACYSRLASCSRYAAITCLHHAPHQWTHVNVGLHSWQRSCRSHNSAP